MVSPLVKQIYVISGVLLTNTLTGMVLSFTTSFLPALQDPESEIKASLEMCSWIVAAYTIAFIPGIFFSSYSLDRYGRRTGCIMSLIPGFIGLLLMFFATGVYCLMAARFLQGFSAASTFPAAIVIGEYSAPVHRGMFLNLKTAALYLGSSIIHLLGYYYQWRSITLFILFLFVLNFGIIWMWPESPLWLASKNDFEKCEKAFYWLRGKSEQSTKELKDMLKAQRDRSKIKYQGMSKNIQTVIRKFGRKDFLLPITIFLFGAILLETSGRHIFPAFGVQIISEISESKGSIYHIFVLDILMFTSTLFSSVIIRMFKRRHLLFITGAISFFLLIGSCVYLYLVSISMISNVAWIPISLFGLYLAVVNFACAPIPLALYGEIFPLEHKAVGTSVGGIFVALFTTIFLTLTPVLLSTVKIYGTFAILGVAMAISLVILYFIMPETKDRTLQEIEDYFNHGKFNVKDRLQEDVEVETKMIS